MVITNGCVILTDFINTKDHKFDYGRVWVKNLLFGSNTIICKSVKLEDNLLLKQVPLLLKIPQIMKFGLIIRQIY